MDEAHATRELARLNEELREREQTRLQLLRKVIRAQEDERKRIARELHDETGQMLTALTLRLDLAQAAAAASAPRSPWPMPGPSRGAASRNCTA